MAGISDSPERALAREVLRRAQYDYDTLVQREQSQCKHKLGPLRDVETQEYVPPTFVRTCSICGLTQGVEEWDKNSK